MPSVYPAPERMHTPQAVTQLLERWSGGDRSALDELMPLVYDELRRLAGNYLRRERAGHTLQPTALVNEAYLLMVDQRRARWQNRAQFVGVAAQMMRRILVDHARAVQAEKRGGQQFAVSLTEAEGFGESPDLDLLRVNEALERLAALDEQQARVVELTLLRRPDHRGGGRGDAHQPRHGRARLEDGARVAEARAGRLRRVISDE